MPYKSVYWLNSHDPDFDEKAREICQLYVDAPKLYQQGRLVICSDEKTGMQILERKYPTRPVEPGKPERREHEYIRHGALTLIGSFAVPTGEVLWDLGLTRTSDDVAGDTVIEQSRTYYDAAGQAVASATFASLPDDTSTTGALDATNSYATASAAWYDGLGRTVASADYGREDVDSAFSHSFFDGTSGALIDSDSDGIPNVAEGSPPTVYGSNGDAINDAYIVAFTQYDDAGRAYRSIDNLGRVNLTLYDVCGKISWRP